MSSNQSKVNMSALDSNHKEEDSSSLKTIPKLGYSTEEREIIETMEKNRLNIPCEEDLMLHDQATSLLKTYRATWPKSDETEDHILFLAQLGVRKIPKNLPRMMENLIDMVGWTQRGVHWDGTGRKIQYRPNESARYNKAASFLRQHGLLKNLLKRTQHGTLICWSSGKERVRGDVVQGEMGLQSDSLTSETYTLKVLDSNGKGGRVFLEKDEALNMLLSNIPNSLKIERDNNRGERRSMCNKAEDILGWFVFPCWSNTRKVTLFKRYRMFIEIQGPDGKWFLNSDSNAIKNMFGIAGKGEHLPKPYNPELLRHSHPEYFKYQEALEKAIHSRINVLYSDPNFEIQCLVCCRTDPSCDELTFCEKPIGPHEDGQDVPCRKCSMELCPYGCGRAGHGGPCNISTDEASELSIRDSSRPCPGCRTPVQKSEGCNHITCRCGVQFCYHCGEPYQRDERGHYMVTEHYQSGRCTQFP